MQAPDTSFDKELAGKLMTLAAIAYAGDGTGNLGTIKTDIETQLGHKHYATKAHWHRVWGPIRGSYGDNLAYVVQHERDPIWAIVLRGTIMDASSWWEDVPTGQKPFPYIPGDATMVSNHFFAGLNGLIEVADDSGVTLPQFMAAATKGTSGPTVYTTGHSQGGGLAPIFLAWVMSAATDWSFSGKLTAQCYAFAPPTSGDPAFAKWIGENATSFQVCNPLDVVPLGYNAMGATITHSIPETPPRAYHWPIWEAERIAQEAGKWQQPATVVPLGSVQLPPSIGYFDQVGDQHNHNSYLWLLGAHETTVGTCSVLPKYATGSPS